MIQTTVTYIVQYDDPDRTVDGVTKTRHFPSEQESREFVQRLDQMAPNAKNVQIIRQKTTQERTNIY